MHYLDNAATTRVLPEAAEAAVRAMCEAFGNPSSLHKMGVEASHLLEDSRRAVAAALGASREKASGLVAAGLVALNHEETLSPSREVKDGDRLSVRGKGRFLLDQVGPPTKKGRLKLSGRKYL